MSDNLGVRCRIRVRKGENEIEVVGLTHEATEEMFNRIAKEYKL